MEQENNTQAISARRLLSLILIAGVPFLYCFFMFFAFHSQILHLQPLSPDMLSQLDPHAVATPVLDTQQDGRESKVLFLMLLLLGPAGFLLIRASVSQKFLVAVAAVLWLIFLTEVHFFKNLFIGITRPHVAFEWIIITLIFGAAVFSLNWLYKKNTLAGRLVIAELALLVCFVPFSDISYSDYSYILSPALRLLQGNKFSDIYFQYDLLPSITAMIPLKYNWSPYTYRYFMEAGMFVFVISSFLIARKFFIHKSLAFFVFALFIMVRFFMGMYDVTFCPQVTSIRLDWWLLLFGCAYFWGMESIIFGLCLMLLLIGVNSFGLIYFICYLLLQAFLLLREAITAYTDGQPYSFVSAFKPWFVRFRLNIGLGFLGLFMHWFITGNLVNESLTLYGGLQLGMLPVSQNSLYWYFVALFAVCFVLLLVFKDKFETRYWHSSMLLLVLFAGNSMYFLGRSHENNVINISGVLLFTVVLCCDVLMHLSDQTSGAPGFRKKLWGLAPVCLIWVALLFRHSAVFADNARDFISALKTGTLEYPESQPFPGALDAIDQLTDGSRKVVFMTFGGTDFYLSYRGKYPMQGHFNPVDTWIFIDREIEHANKCLAEGYTIVIFDADVYFKRDILPKLAYSKFRTNGGYMALIK